MCFFNIKYGKIITIENVKIRGDMVKTLKQKVKHMGNWIKKMSLRKKIILSIIISNVRNE